MRYAIRDLRPVAVLWQSYAVHYRQMGFVTATRPPKEAQLHIIRIFILRLLIDPDEPGALRGSLQPVPEGEAQPFADEQALLAALRKVVRLPAEGPADTEKE